MSMNVQDSLTSSTQSTEVEPKVGIMAVTLSGTWTGTAAVQRSLDGGSTWHTVARDVDGNLAEYTANTSLNVAVQVPNEQYRVDFTHSSGTLVLDFDQ